MKFPTMTHSMLALGVVLALAGCSQDAADASAPTTPAATAPVQADTATQVAEARANGHEEGMEMERDAHERGMEMTQDAHQAAGAHPTPNSATPMPADPAMPMDHKMPMKDPPKAEPKPDPMPMSDM
jgi:hypothetical protein